MLFDLRPKERLKDLFDRTEEYAELSRLVDAGSWVAVLGKRMTGKTSLIKTYAKENDGVYINLMGARGIEHLARKIMAESGFRLEEVGIDLKLLHIKWTRVVEETFSKLKHKVIVLDEIQEVSSPYLFRVLKNAWDTHRELRIIFSGSYMGILKGLLHPDASSPLYGRRPAKIILRPFSNETSRRFLMAGFRQHGHVEVTSKELEEAVERLDGYAGWLTHYGNFRLTRKLPHEEALRETTDEGSKTLVLELNKFLRNRRKDIYAKVLRMAVVGARWSDIKKEVVVNNKVLSDILHSLTAAMLVEEKAGYYWIADPLLKEAVRLLR